MRFKRREYAIRLFIMMVSFLFSCFLLEVGYRIYLHQSLIEATDFGFTAIDKPMFTFDEERGFLYIPDRQIQAKLFTKDNQLILEQTFHINNLGHISTEDEQIEKPEKTFRIAALGDSFTAGDYISVPWTDRLEVALNGDDELKSQLSIDRFEVMNFGMGSTGIVQFTSQYKDYVSQFEPDMIIVSFISDDITRAFLWIDTLPLPDNSNDIGMTVMCGTPDVTLANPTCAFGNRVALPVDMITPDAVRSIKPSLVKGLVDSLPWNSIDSEILNVLLKKPRKFVLNNEYMRRYGDEEQAINLGISALKELNASHPNVMIFHLPLPLEIINQQVDPITQRFFASAVNSKVEIISTLAYMPGYEPDKVSGWFHPVHGHLSESGAQMWTALLYQQIEDRLYGGSQ